MNTIAKYVGIGTVGLVLAACGTSPTDVSTATAPPPVSVTPSGVDVGATPEPAPATVAPATSAPVETRESKLADWWGDNRTKWNGMTDRFSAADLAGGVALMNSIDRIPDQALQRLWTRYQQHMNLALLHLNTGSIDGATSEVTIAVKIMHDLTAQIPSA